MLPEPDSHIQGVLQGQEDHEISTDAVETFSPRSSRTRVHIAHATQRAPCTCPCLSEGPRAVTSMAPPSSTVPSSSAHSTPVNCSDAGRPRDEWKEIAKTSNSATVEKHVYATKPPTLSYTSTTRDRCNESNGEERDEYTVGQVMGDRVTRPSRVADQAEPLIALLRAEKKEPIISSFFLQLLTLGDALPGDSGVPLDDKPEWVDVEKIRLGQRFAQKYFFGLVFSEMISLFLLFSFSGSLQPLIFSGNSDTPFKAFKRYLSTFARVSAWYSGDFWAEGEARHHLRAVRRLHDIYRRRLNALRGALREELRRVTHLHGPLWTAGAAQAMRADFAGAAAACPFLDLQEGRVEWINQLEMSITQMGFVGLAATFPERFGAGGASKDELEGFVHLWRVIGHLLGVEERFNFCSEGLEGVRQRTKFLLSTVFPNSLARVGAEWEHMTRCVLAGVNHYVEGITYEVSLMYLLETCGMDCPEVRKLLSVRDRHLYRGACFLLRWVLRVPLLRALVNWILRRNIKRVQNASPEWMRKSEQRAYGFESHKIPQTY